mgnify:CR=1 FL=1
MKKTLENENIENAVEIENLTVYYQEVCALSNISLTIKDKEFIGIIGPNGGGKTTLLRSILGLIRSYTGNIRIYGRSPDKAHGLLGYVPQLAKFNRNFPISVMEVVLMGRLSGRIPVFHRYTAEDRSIAESIMNDLGIYELRNRQIGQLSGGQLQRVLIARALAVQPKILLLDEPTASLDAGSKSDIYDILKKLNETITIILVSHDMAAISSYIHTLACLNTKLYYHGEAKLNEAVLYQIYGCPVDLIAHGVPHRVLKEHEEEDYA